MMLAAVLVAGLTGQAPAAPEDRRLGATVLGSDAAGTVVTLRAGVNDIVCLADDPKEAACGFDPATGTVADAYLRWVIYTPFATPETTGLPIRPVPGGPWLTFPGTPRRTS